MYATEIAFLILFERASVVLLNGANGSVIAVTDPKLQYFAIKYVRILYILDYFDG